jgi:putative FmdB family regulatory protein
MPTYDYECKACHHRWELFQSIKAEPEKKCPKCGKRQAQRVIGPGAGIIFKGSGFYQTDYRSSAYKKAAEADTKASEGTSAKSNGESSSSKSDSKPAESKSSPEKSGGTKSGGAKSGGGSKESS